MDHFRFVGERAFELLDPALTGVAVAATRDRNLERDLVRQDLDSPSILPAVDPDSGRPCSLGFGGAVGVRGTHGSWSFFLVFLGTPV